MSEWSVAQYGSVREAVASTIGPGVEILRGSSIAGGCIAGGKRLDLSNGDALFLKESTHLPVDMFVTEAEGLSLLQNDHLRVPRPLGWGRSGSSTFLLMEFMPSESRAHDYDRVLGVGLARLHRGRTDRRAGLPFDNYIGSTPQRNTLCDSWIEFFSTQRIGFQVELARKRGILDATTAVNALRVADKLGELLPESEEKSLLHGDLWGGNVIVGPNGLPVLIDPAVYFGHREADLAMTELFGGFSSGFYDAYENEWPLEPGYRDRRDLYNLYHMLNHLNIFGGSYLGSVRSIVRHYA
jgi:protein-ribulosamine 3-kinase